MSSIVRLLLAVTLLFAMRPAQSPAPAIGSQTVEPPVTTLKASIRLVELSVVVQDKNGLPVPGLTKDDFTVLDQGEPQEISLFSLAGGAPTAPGVKTLPVGIYTNRPEMTTDVPGNLTVVLLDALNTNAEDQSYARTQALKFLEQLQQQDHVAIYVLTTKLEVLHDFTQDINQLIAAAAGYRGHLSSQLYANQKPLVDLTSSFPAASPLPDQPPAGSGGSSRATSISDRAQILQRLFENSELRHQDLAVINRVEATLSAIEDIAHHLAPVPGRKNLVWISGSFPLAIGQEGPTKQDPTRETHTFERQLDRAVRALNQANLAVYPVDARGLMASVNYDASDPQLVNPRRDPGFKQERDTRDFVSMDLLAERTGGQSFHNNNDLSGVVRKALADGELTYQLAFYPSHGKWDGKYHQIRIHVKRSDLQLQYRRGYFAIPEPTNDQEELKTALDGAVASPIDATNLSLLAQMSLPGKENLDQFGLSLMLNPREIEFVETAAGKSCVLDFVFVQRDAAGKQLSGEQRHAEFTMNPQRYESVFQTGLLVSNHMRLLRGIAILRIVARDAKSGAIGSVTIPMNIPAPKT
jgi:VWFA-related protein